jgi:hypothetical protein
MSEHAFAEQHRRLERIFQALVSETGREDPLALRQQWAAFEAELLGHLDEEERRWLPGFARLHPEEAERIRREHAEIRSTLTELGVMLDLHALRADVVCAFVEKLRAHATREDGAFYRWILAAGPQDQEGARP